MDKIFEFNTTLYPIKIWVTIGASEQYLNTVFKNNIHPLPNGLHGKTTLEYKVNNPTECGVLVRFDSELNMTMKQIAHESAHAALKIFEKIGAKVSDDSDELFAYLIGYIAECINNINNNH